MFNWENGTDCAWDLQFVVYTADTIHLAEFVEVWYCAFYPVFCYKQQYWLFIKINVSIVSIIIAWYQIGIFE